MASSYFDTLKSTGIANARPFGVCSNLHAYMKAPDFQELIDAAIPDMIYLYRSGIVTDAMLAEVDEGLLNENGIYTTNATVTNPGVEVFILSTAVVTVNIDNGERHNVNVMGTGTANINISGNSYCTIKTFQQSEAIIAISDTSNFCLKTRQNSVASITASDSVTADITANGDSQIEATFNDASYAKIQGFAHAEISTAGTGNFYVILYELSKDLTPVI